MTEQEFRDELRRQILEGKLLELRVRPRVRVTEQDATRHISDTTRHSRPAIDGSESMALRITQHAAADEFQARMALANEIVRRAKGGEDFCALGRSVLGRYNDAVDLWFARAQAFATLMPQIQEAVATLKSGEVSAPITCAIFAG